MRKWKKRARRVFPDPKANWDPVSPHPWVENNDRTMLGFNTWCYLVLGLTVSFISSELTWKIDVRRIWWSQSLFYQRCTWTSQHAGSTCREFPSAFWGCWGCSLEDLYKQQRDASCRDNFQGVSCRKTRLITEELLCSSWLLTLIIFCRSDTVDKCYTDISCLNLQRVCVSILILTQKG